MNTLLKIQLAVSVLVLMISQLASAVPNCQEQAKQYPITHDQWANTAPEETIWFCSSYENIKSPTAKGAAFKLKLGKMNNQREQYMSLVLQDMTPDPLNQKRTFTDSADYKKVYRIILQADDVDRLREGTYFSTMMRSYDSCLEEQTGKLTYAVVVRLNQPPSDNGFAVTPHSSSYQDRYIRCAKTNAAKIVMDSNGEMKSGT